MLYQQYPPLHAAHGNSNFGGGVSPTARPLAPSSSHNRHTKPSVQLPCYENNSLYSKQKTESLTPRVIDPFRIVTCTASINKRRKELMQNKQREEKTRQEILQGFFMNSEHVRLKKRIQSGIEAAAQFQVTGMQLRDSATGLTAFATHYGRPPQTSQQQRPSSHTRAIHHYHQSDATQVQPDNTMFEGQNALLQQEERLSVLMSTQTQQQNRTKKQKSVPGFAIQALQNIENEELHSATAANLGNFVDTTNTPSNQQESDNSTLESFQITPWENIQPNLKSRASILNWLNKENCEELAPVSDFTDHSAENNLYYDFAWRSAQDSSMYHSGKKRKHHHNMQQNLTTNSTASRSGVHHKALSKTSAKKQQQAPVRGSTASSHHRRQASAGRAHRQGRSFHIAANVASPTACNRSEITDLCFADDNLKALCVEGVMQKRQSGNACQAKTMLLFNNTQESMQRNCTRTAGLTEEVNVQSRRSRRSNRTRNLSPLISTSNAHNTADKNRMPPSCTLYIVKNISADKEGATIAKTVAIAPNLASFQSSSSSSSSSSHIIQALQ